MCYGFPAVTADRATADARRGHLHHVEVWVPDLAAARHSWGWLLAELGWTPFQEWPAGHSWNGVQPSSARSQPQLWRAAARSGTQTSTWCKCPRRASAVARSAVTAGNP